ncbi:MAG TPA: hypothetical protein VGR57_17715, partial [Ktedonobacterales bacterium]|nr:hypothetical protein [Ktedonobacterales bacterium]
SSTIVPPVWPPLQGMWLAIIVIEYPLLAAFVLTFPTGRFAPRWSALLIPLWIAQFGLFIGGAPDAAIVVSTIVTWGSVGAIQLYRYIRLYTPAQQQQTKWVVVSLVVLNVLLLEIVYPLAPRLWPALNAPGSAYRLARILVIALSWMPISLGVGIAILRYRLYDIDIIIRRTLIYGTLTALLVGVYFSAVIGFEGVVQTITGHQSLPAVVVVAITLLVAALFNPLRRRIQEFIDRRFYRRKYDAAATVAAFSALLRNEVDLTQVETQLQLVVASTMQPAHVSLWLPVRHAPADVGTLDVDWNAVGGVSPLSVRSKPGDEEQPPGHPDAATGA